jgi:hypothetical protein
MGAYDRDEVGYRLPPDLEINPTVAAASAAAGSKDSYTKKINLPLVKNKKYNFFFTYFHEDPETKEIKESDRSPVWTESFTIPNLTKAVQNLTLTPGLKSYGVKFNIDPTSIQEDVVIFESLTGAFAGEEYIVYVGTSTNVTIQTSNYAPRWARVRSRDKWDDLNITNVSAGPVTPLNAEVDTTRVPTAPLNSTVSGSIDPDDLSGFSVKITASWTANTDADTNGYVIRWSSQDPSVVANPLWEYGQVDGKATTTFSITGLTPNTKYYWQVTSKSPFNTISWASPQSGTVGPVVDPNAPADVWSQLRSIISIGGKTADLFKIGTGISQSINTSSTITPSQTAGTYSGIILNRSTTNFGHNYWLNTGQFRVGSASAFLYWDGSDVYTTGKINATGGTFTGNLRVTTGSIISGGTFAPDGSVSGARVVMQPSGLFAHDATGAQSVVIQSSDGLIDARKGYIGGWTLDGTAQTTGSIQSSNTKIESNGTITLGDITGTLGSIVRLSATDPFRIWIGSQSSSNAPFKVSSAGVLTATGATITGNVQITSGSTYDSIVAAQAAATAASAAAGTASTNASSALTTANGKNSIFRTGSTPTALKIGDIWINSNDANKLYVAEAAGTGNWVLSRDTAIAAAVATADAAQASANAAVATANAAYPASNFSKSAILQAINASTNGTKLNGGILETGTVLADNVVSTYVYAGFINADKINAGTLQGRDINVTGESIGTGTFDADSATYGDISSSSNALTTMYTRTPIGGYSGIKSVGINAIALISTSTAGVTSSWYPYYDGSGDLGIKSGSTTSAYRWRNLRLTGDVYIGGDGSTNTVGATGGPIIRLLNTGRIYANTLGTGSGNPIVQDGGYLRVQTSSLIYKENVNQISKSGYLDIINLLRPVTYNYIGDTGYNGGPRTLSGFIAEDLHEIPQLRTVINYNQENKPDGIAYDRLTASLVLALQEMSDKIEDLQYRLDALEA